MSDTSDTASTDSTEAAEPTTPDVSTGDVAGDVNVTESTPPADPAEDGAG